MWPIVLIENILKAILAKYGKLPGLGTKERKLVIIRSPNKIYKGIFVNLVVCSGIS